MSGYEIPVICWILCGVSFILFIWGWYAIEKTYKQEMEKRKRLPYRYW